MKQINQTVEFLEGQINEVAGNLPVAFVEEVKNNDVIVNYKGKKLYAVTKENCKKGDVLLVDGATKVPVKPENTDMEMFEDGTDNNAVTISKLLNGNEGEFVRTMNITVSYLKTLSA